MKQFHQLAGAVLCALFLAACGGGGGGGEASPVTTGAPDDSGAPDTSGTPAAPGTPGTPGTPGAPGTTDTAATPGTPGTPGSPGAPDTTGAPGVTPTPSLAGLYSGTTTVAGGTFDALILRSGRMYGIQGANSGIGSVFFGDGNVTAAGYASSRGASLSASSGLTTTPAAATLTGVPRTSISGSTASASSAATFTANYRSSFEATPSLADVAGRYGGQFAGLGPGDGFLLTLTVDAAGGLSGTTGSGCGHGGKLTPTTGANVYEVSITFASGCRKQGLLLGHALWQPAAGAAPATLTIFAISGDFRDGWFYLGGKN